MIRRLVDFALDNRFLVLAIALLLFVWGIISFHNLPVEAYPDVANNYVELITQWPGRAAEGVDGDVRRTVRAAQVAVVGRFDPGLTHDVLRLVAGSGGGAELRGADRTDDAGRGRIDGRGCDRQRR